MNTAAWRSIGSLRSAPPGLAANEKDPRRKSFGAALQQAEELALAAEAVGYATKPLQLFYMLSQAGRAIVAAHHSTKAEIKGHGISFHLKQNGKILLGKLEVPEPRPVKTCKRCGDVTSPASPAPQGAFQDVAHATGSPGLSAPVHLGPLWRANPDLADADIPSPHSDGDWWPPISSALGTRQPPPDPTGPITTGGLVGVRLAMPGETGAEVNAAIARYPSLAGCQAFNPGEPAGTYAGADETVARDPQTGMVIVARSAPTSLSMRDLWQFQDNLHSHVTVDGSAPKWPNPTYIGWVLPSISGAASPSALMLWWGLLYGLSSLARYYPAAWTSAINRDSSTLAEPLREVLDRAVDRVPARIAEALEG